MMKPGGLQVTRAHSPSRTALQSSCGRAKASGVAPSHDAGGAAAAVPPLLADAGGPAVESGGALASALPRPRDRHTVKMAIRFILRSISIQIRLRSRALTAS